MHLICTRNTFRAVDHSDVRWLSVADDYELMRRSCLEWGVGDLSRPEWESWWADPYPMEYCAVIEKGRIISSAGAWHFSEEAWDVSAVGTAKDMRGKGYGRKVVSFVTKYILDSGRTATCATRGDNEAMIRTAKSVGFTPVSPEKVWWQYPPDEEEWKPESTRE